MSIKQLLKKKQMKKDIFEEIKGHLFIVRPEYRAEFLPSAERAELLISIAF